MKKSLSLLTALLAVVLLMAACGTADPSPAPATPTSPASPDLDTDSETSQPPATCTVISGETPDPAHPDDHITGAREDYAVTIIIYNDFTCEGCASIAASMNQAVAAYPEDIRLIFRHYTSPTLSALMAARAVEAASRQGKFWQMHDLLFAEQAQWVGLDEEALFAFFSDQFEALEIDPDQFMVDYADPAIDDRISEDFLEASGSGQSAPYLTVNGTVPPLYLTSIRDFFLWLDSLMIPYGRHLQSRQFTECPPMTVDPAGTYTATLHTTQGDIVLALYPDLAPLTVNNFIFLAENDYYDNTPVYAVIENYLVRAGDPSGTGWGAPGFLFDLEISSQIGFDRPYMLAMQNSGPGTSNGQFFITLSPLSQLNGRNTIFGEVISGVEVLQALSPRNPDTDPLAPLNDEILDITIEE
jgi:cyclophilin family peptidyl-prolyl cis-trans isomerase